MGIIRRMRNSRSEGGDAPDKDLQRARSIRAAASEFSDSPYDRDATIAVMTAKDILHEDLGWDSDRPPENFYDLDKDTQDRLITHARQDAAHAVLTAGQTLDVVYGIQRRLKRIGFLVGIIAVCAIVLVVSQVL